MATLFHRRVDGTQSQLSLLKAIVCMFRVGLLVGLSDRVKSYFAVLLSLTTPWKSKRRIQTNCSFSICLALPGLSLMVFL